MFGTKEMWYPPGAFAGDELAGETMAEDDEAPRRKVSHVIGEKLDDLSVSDFDLRIGLLRAEIERLEVAQRLKRAALDDAGSIFRR